MYLVNCICGVLELLLVRMYKSNFLLADNRHDALGDLGSCWLRSGKGGVEKVVAHSYIRTELER